MFRGVFAAMGCAVVLSTGPAFAFCRSTTCRGDACPTDEDGCPASGAKLYWPTSCIGFSLQRNATLNLLYDDVERAMTKAFQAWADLSCDGGRASLTFTRLADVACKRLDYRDKGPNVNVVFFEDEYFNYRGIDGTLAKTSVTFDDRTGEILDADIVVNSANNVLTVADPPGRVEYDLQAILTHEVGHFIGIAHSPNPEAVMNPSYAPGSIDQRTLTEDDVAAVCAAYPPNREVTCSAEPRGGLADRCDDEESKGCAVDHRSDAKDGALWPLAMLSAFIVWRKVAARDSITRVNGGYKALRRLG